MTQTLDAPPGQSSASDRAEAWFRDFEAALKSRDVGAASALFATQSFWRDLVSFTWNLTTVENPEGVADLLEANLDRVDPSGFALTEPADEAGGVVTAWFAFETSTGRGNGLLRLKEEEGRDKAWTFLTTLHELKGHEEPRGTHRPMGAEHGASKDRRTWKEKRQAEAESLGSTTQPYVLVIGGGQGGIALGSRLRQLGVPTLVVDKHPRPGDQWRNRYKSLCLHDPVWYDHLPYLKFPDNWPVFAPKDKIGDWLESYVKVMEVPYWSSTTATSATWSEETGEWTVQVEREGMPLTLRPKQLVFATGMSGKARMPEIAGTDVFRGDVHHSSAHPGPDAYRGKKAVVIGSNNSAFDICGALWENDVDVTMVQRSSTHIVKSDSLMEIGLGDLYSERAVASGVTTEKADMIFASLPYRILHDVPDPGVRGDGRAGQGLLRPPGEGRVLARLGRRRVGAVHEVPAARLRLLHRRRRGRPGGERRRASSCSGQVDHLTEDAVVLEDGTTLPADVVVFATGYNSMNGWVADLIDQETADRLGKVWGLGSDTTKDPGPWEGEQRNMWKPTQVDNLWMHGGNLHQSRHYSLYLALQLKARYEGIDTPVYALQEVHHTA